MQLFCPACENKIDAKLVSGYNYKHELFKNKKLYQCRVCGLIFVQPMPTFDELDFYYKNVWLKVEGAVPESKEAELVYQIQAEERVQYLSRHIKIPENVQILDIGSGYGYLYEAFQGKMREGIDFYATDPNQKNLKRLQEKGIRAFADIAEIKNRSFDLITLCSVLEHIPNPFSYLKMVLAYLKNDGCLFIDLPERDDTFKPILEPHVAVYTRESLSRLVDKLGLEIVHITGHGLRRSVLMSRLHFQKTRLGKGWHLFLKVFNKLKVSIVGEANTQKKISDLYKQYACGEEGSDRWWLRAVLRRKKALNP